MTSRSLTNVLTKLYTDPGEATAFGSLNRLFAEAKRRLGKTVTRKKVKAFLSAQRGYVLHKPVIRKFQRSKIFAPFKNALWESDLTDVANLKRNNGGVRFLLVAVDVFSKYAYAQPLISKHGKTVASAFQRILSKSNHPRQLRTDQGSEYKNVHFKRLMKKYNINHYTTLEGDIKTGVAERFNRTIKGRIYKLMTSTGSRTYIHQLQKLVDAYNSVPHSVTKVAPKMVNKLNTAAIYKRIYGREREETENHRPKLLVGDNVLITNENTIYSRGFTANFKKEIFKIKKVVMHYPFRYLLEDANNEPILGSFYIQELQKVSPDIKL
jgi:transposase InsO family protein